MVNKPAIPTKKMFYQKDKMFNISSKTSKLHLKMTPKLCHENDVMTTLIFATLQHRIVLYVDTTLLKPDFYSSD